MGMGEPLNNYAVVRAAVEAMCDPFHWGLRKKGVTVSTVGVAPALRKLTRELPDVRVALSLHAPTQALRERIVPAARHWPLDELVDALDDHLAKTAKRHSSSSSGMMVEYVLIKGVNDAPAEADALAALFARRNVYLNIIPYNRNVTAEIHGFEPPDEATARAFGKRINNAGVRVRLRKEYGADIAAACGQLALDSAAAKKSFNAIDIEDAAGGPAGPAKRRTRTFGPRKAAAEGRAAFAERLLGGEKRYPARTDRITCGQPTRTLQQQEEQMATRSPQLCSFSLPLPSPEAFYVVRASGPTLVASTTVRGGAAPWPAALQMLETDSRDPAHFRAHAPLQLRHS